MSKYKALTDLIPLLKDNSQNHWHEQPQGEPPCMPYVDYSRAVREMEEKVYNIADKKPELKNYSEILEENGLSWNSKAMDSADISNADETLIFALLIGAFRAERFCDGALLSFLENGSIVRWLERLKELDKA